MVGFKIKLNVMIQSYFLNLCVKDKIWN